MKIIKALELDKYLDRERYAPVQNGVYKDLEEGSYCMTLYCELEEDEDSQYPLEDILDQYLLNCTDYSEELEIDGKQIYIFELESPDDLGEDALQNILEVAQLVGKRVFNYDQGDSVLLGIE